MTLLSSESGQMVVELAVLVPVLIVVALVGFNLVRFAGACAAFDRVALDAVVAQGVAPAGDQNSGVAVGEVRRCIEEALPMDDVEVEVTVQGMEDAPGRGDGRGLSFPASPLLTRFSCTMRYRPWPSALSIAGVDAGVPLALVHERSLVVDRFRPGMVV